MPTKGKTLINSDQCIRQYECEQRLQLVSQFRPPLNKETHFKNLRNYFIDNILLNVYTL